MMEYNRMGLAVLRDIRLIETLAAMNRKNLPERVLHAKGVGAKGYFRVYMPMSDFTCAQFLQDTEQATPVFVRFSTTAGSRGSADTVRDERGFAVKFYTEEGNYDLISGSLPVRFISDPEKIPRVLAAFAPEKESGLVSAEQFWRFAAETPEAVHKTLWLFSDRGTLKSYRHMEAFGTGTYVWVNGEGDRHLVRYQWKPLEGRKEITRQEAEFLAGFDPDAACRDLHGALERGEYPEFELWAQLVPWKQKNSFSMDLEDATLRWPERGTLSLRVGKLTLNGNPEDVYEETEKAAFSPACLVPGIELSQDRLLPAMAFACRDAQRHRLGMEVERAWINQPLSSKPNLKPEEMFPSQELSEDSLAYPPSAEEDWETAEDLALSQAGSFYRSLCARDQDHLIGNLLDHMLFIDDEIKETVVGSFKKADSNLGEQLTRSMDF